MARSDVLRRDFPGRAILASGWRQIRFWLSLRDPLVRLAFLRRSNEYDRFVLAEHLAAFGYTKFSFSEYGRIWMDDPEFLNWYKKECDSTNFHSMDRKWCLKELLKLVADVPGETAECGVYAGASSWLICEHFRNSAKTHYGFDSFEGVSAPAAADGGYWKKGDLTTNESIANARLKGQRATLLKGWIPDRFADVADLNFCFVHVDVDLYEPTRDSLQFFYPRLSPGGIIICDDYGFSSCPGAKKAFDELAASVREKLVHLPTGQGMIMKGR